MDCSSRRGRSSRLQKQQLSEEQQHHVANISGFQRHPLHVKYSTMEMEHARNHSQLYSDSLKKRAKQRHSQLIIPLTVFGMFCGVVIGLAISKAAFQTSTNKPDKSEDDTNTSTFQQLSTAAAHQNVKLVCSAENIKTLMGLQSCEAACNTAQCCRLLADHPDACWIKGNDDNKNGALCMEYHRSCMILDGILSTGEPHDLLPAGYTGGWFGVNGEEQEHHHHHTEHGSKKILPANNSKVQNQLARTKACTEMSGSKHGMKECVQLCLPATCCYDGHNHIRKSTCSSADGETIDCRHYHACDVLYGN